MKLKALVINFVPFLGKYKRFLKALWFTILPIKSTYSQHGEDKIIFSIISKLNLDRTIYVDVGANHPSDISNTYLFYRKGYTGITIEPNLELINLHKIFRKRDIQLAIGCDDNNSVQKFYVSKTPVLSSYSKLNNSELHKYYYTPVLKLDTILAQIEIQKIFLLNIDVEGLNLEVLNGASNSLTKCIVLCIEFDSDDEKENINKLLGNQFKYYKEVGCNLIYINKSYLGDLLI